MDAGLELDARIGHDQRADVDRLDALLERQNYRLARWQTAGFELDYRRFFDVNGLAALRMEDPDVFADTHARVLQWLLAGELDGVRIDHPDGLRDPLGYLERLRRAAPRAWIVVEKVLAPAEDTTADWPDRGHHRLRLRELARSGCSLDPAGEAPMTATYAGFAWELDDFSAGRAPQPAPGDGRACSRCDLSRLRSCS